MSFEDRFAAMGRRIDDLVYSISSKRKPSIRVGPSIGERLQDSLHSAQDWAASQRNKVSAEKIEQMDPRAKMALIAVCAMLVGGAAVGLTLHYMGGGGGSLSPEELQRLEKMRGSGGMSMFATPPPAADGTKAPTPLPKTRGGSLTGGR